MRKQVMGKKETNDKPKFYPGARPYWTGHIRISLVSFPVAIFSAINKQRQIAMHLIHQPSGQRVHHQNVVDGRPVMDEDIVKGYEFEKNSYVLIEPEEIDAIKVPSKEILDIAQFVYADEIDPIYYDKPYFVMPEGDLPEDAYIVIREALYKSGKLAIGQLSMRGREHICAIGPLGNGLFMQTLRYGEEVRNAERYFRHIPDRHPNRDEIELAYELIEHKTGHFDPMYFHDRYKDALQELINSKIENREPEYEVITKPSPKVVNLMDALKKSLAQKAKAAKQMPAHRRG